MSTSSEDMNAKVVTEFRANGGTVGGPFEHMSLLLLHHTGARSGKPYVLPLAYLADDDRYALFASKAGAPENPAWYHNLKAHPRVQVEVGTETLDVVAEEATGAERDRLFRAQAEHSPQFEGYQRKTERVIPVVVLTPAV